MPPLSSLDKFKLDLDDSEQRLDLGADLSLLVSSLLVILSLGRVSQNTSSFAGSHGNMPSGLSLEAPLGPTVTSTSKDSSHLQ
jgi:hypothetical protein